MAIDSFDRLARTVEIQPARVHLEGIYAGAIEVPIYIGDYRNCGMELDDFFLEIEGEPDCLKPARREFFNGQLRFLFISERLRETKRLPREMQLHWGEKPQEGSCGMTLEFYEWKDNGPARKS
jgi:hypothetical protein